MTESIQCPYCRRTDGQTKAGLYKGIQRYRCIVCNRRYTPSQPRGYSAEIRKQAIELKEAGKGIRQIARELNVNPNSVLNWIKNSGQPNVDPGKPVKIPPKSVQPLNAVKRRVTIVDVAKAADVSIATISNYLNDKVITREATKRRIDKAMAELNFTPNSLIRAIRQGRTRIMGVVMHGNLSISYKHSVGIGPVILSGINDAADIKEFNILLYTGWPHRKSRTGLDFLDGYADGLIWAGPEVITSEMQHICKAGLPMVVLLSRAVPEGAGFVVVDNADGMRKIVAHLAGLGHTRIAYAGPTHRSDFQDRLDGYRLGLQDHGIEYDPRLVAADAVISTNWIHTTMQDYANAINMWLVMPDKPTAIMFGLDIAALWAIEFLQNQGLRIPEDIAVTGFDNIPASETQFGGLTTVHQPFIEIGKAGVECLAALMEGESVDNCKMILPAELVVRASTLTSK